MKMPRKWFANLHRWVGLSVGVVLSLLGLTGSILVFQHELEAYVLNRDVWIDPTPTAKPSIGVALDRLMVQRPDATDHAVRRSWLDDTRHVAFFFRPQPGGESQRFAAALDSQQSAIVAEWEWGSLPPTRRGLLSQIYELHRHLLVGETGLWITGISGLLTIVLVVLGYKLWWPKAGQWHSALSYKTGASWRRAHYDIHKIAGAVAGTLLTVLAFTGIYLALPGPFVAVTSSLVEVANVGPAPQSSVRRGPRISGAEAEAIARVALPDAELFSLFAPADGQDVFTANMRDPEYVRRSGGGSVVHIDQYSGGVLRVDDSRRDVPGKVFLAWLFPTHNGEVLGLVGRILVCIAGLLPLTMLVTGFVLWLHRRTADERKGVRHLQRGAAAKSSATER